MQPTCVLLIAGDEQFIQPVHQVLDNPEKSFKVQVLRDVAIARARIAGGGIDAVLAVVSRDGRLGVAISDLPKLCVPGSPPVVALCPSGEDALGPEAVRLGTRAYLSLSRCEDLQKILDAIIRRDRSPRGSGRIVSFMGAKGGVGTTTVVLNLASSLARSRDVTLVELRPPPGTLMSYLRPHQTVVDIGKLFSEESKYFRPGSVSAALWSPPGIRRLRVLFAPADLGCPFNMQADQVQALAEQLSGMSDLVLIDLGLPSWNANLEMLRASDVLTIVIEREPICLELAKLMLDFTDKSGATPGSVALAVVNRTVVPCPVPIAEIETALKLPVSGVLPPAAELCIAAQHSRSPVVLSNPGSLLAESFSALARNIAA